MSFAYLGRFPEVLGEARCKNVSHAPAGPLISIACCHVGLQGFMSYAEMAVAAHRAVRHLGVHPLKYTHVHTLVGVALGGFVNALFDVSTNSLMMVLVELLPRRSWGTAVEEACSILQRNTVCRRAESFR